MIAVDTNILVYSVREDSPLHEAALSCIRELAESSGQWAIPWPCVHEFLAIVTHPKIYKPSMPVADALKQVSNWMESPSVVLLAETQNYWGHLAALAAGSKVSGGQIHDARIAAICLSHGVREFWTADRDFSRFPALRVKNPLV